MLKELLTTFVISASAAGVDVTPHDATQYLDKQATCLAKNMYYEARSQGLAGQLAVSLVVLNRVKDKRYPNTICEVIHQGPTRESWKKNGVFYPIKNRCQFSWYCDGKSDEPKDSVTWMESIRIADICLLYTSPSPRDRTRSRMPSSA